MPKTVNSNGKRPEYRALEIMQIGKPVTPSAIDKHTKTGTYSSKYMSFLKKAGFVINVNKLGRSVVSYTLVSRPDDSKLPVGAFDKPVKEKKVAAAKKPKAKTKAKPKAKAKATKKKVKVISVDTENFVLPTKKKIVAKAAARKTEKRDPDTITETFGDSGEYSGGSFSVDGGFDELDPRELA